MSPKTSPGQKITVTATLFIVTRRNLYVKMSPKTSPGQKIIVTATLFSVTGISSGFRKCCGTRHVLQPRSAPLF
jgi:hypothetical protein